jgi:hypothetical protein
MAYARFWALGALVLALVAAGAGCGAKNEQKELVPVAGRVTLDGKPVHSTTVTFIPVSGNGSDATAATKLDGSFQLATFRGGVTPGDGALPGEYKVVISYSPELEVFKDIQPGMSQAEANAAYGKGMAERAQHVANPTFRIPAAYSNPKKTPLRQVVPPAGPVIFALQSEKAEPGAAKPPNGPAPAAKEGAKEKGKKQE